ncbi:protein PLASTID MOVEMENT IMPAIRED 2-like isoform X1 [Macadamia integrifolia]|uniref:protein PLASTID MOVEMENT IMPAIRED 2-like isoform X1 n=1 Tax=Macadamia integrifolia TaxID=60698 RepID=UPI001C4EAE01|nr:protein PLASTID MOVEMENT IMPAIRED 2-like isoform X1 [Macadamia integrifolia]XP_042500958.1 protein PLASTID MOVEMENT IMPAIRED 2-like isoform X1 [Macadamia integrifolia]
MQIGSVKAAISLVGERINEEKPQPKKTQMKFSDLQKKPPSRAKELHVAMRDIGHLSENKKVAESVKAQAESELYTARMRVKDLTSRIEESNLKAKAQKYELEKLQKNWGGRADNLQYAQVMKELEFVKQELSKLKLERDSFLEEKLRAEKEFEASVSKFKFHSSTVEILRKEIEEANEEQVLVHLARIEAVKELEAIEAQRGAEASQFSVKLGRTRNRIKDMTQELDDAKELERKLATTTSDVNVTENELQLAKGMDQRDEKTELSVDNRIHQASEEESQTSRLSQSITEELDAAKKELALIRKEGFQLMASMDIIRDELKQVSEESAQLRTSEKKTDLLVRNLNSKLLRAKSKLENAYRAEDQAKTIVSNLSETLQKLQTETKAANKERELFSEEAASIRTEIQKTQNDNELAEVMLLAAMKELEVVKASEAIAHESLKSLTERIMKSRASASRHKSSITITKFEYEYLTSCAEGAKEIARKKVAAAQAWIEALRASEKEILVNTEAAKREIRELRLLEEQEVHRTEKSMKMEREIEEELYDLKQHHEKNPEATNMKLEKSLSRKSIKNSGSSTPTIRARSRRPSSPGTPLLNRSTSISIRKRRLVMPNLVKIFARKKTKNHL